MAVALQQVAKGSLVLEASGPAVFSSLPSGPMVADYNVVYNTSDSLYTYLYSFTPLSGSPIEDFSVNAGYVSSVLTTANVIKGSPYTITGSITSDGTFDQSLSEVSWSYDPATSAVQIIGFTSYIGPGTGTGSLMNDNAGPWSSAFGLEPSPVPEMSTMISSALMLLPLSVGIVRSMLKARI